MFWFLLAWRKCFDFKGRARRREYWYFTLFYALCMVLAIVLDMLWGTFNPSVSMGLLTGGYLMASILPMMAVSARRLHDIGRSAWWLLLNFVPGFGSTALAVIALFDSQPGSNAYGMNPKEAQEESEAVDFHSGQRRRKSRLAGLARTALLVTAVAAFAMGSGWVWWQQNAQELLAAGQIQLEKGKVAGRMLDETACVGAAADALSVEAGNSLAAGIANSVQLSGCLQTSRATPGFCEGIPSHTEILATGQWIASVCNQIGHGGNTSCNSMMQQIPEYCASENRSKKLGSESVGNT